MDDPSTCYVERNAGSCIITKVVSIKLVMD